MGAPAEAGEGGQDRMVQVKVGEAKVEVEVLPVRGGQAMVEVMAALVEVAKALVTQTIPTPDQLVTPTPDSGMVHKPQKCVKFAGH